MSKNLKIKRVALVAISALGIGVLSVTPAFAANVVTTTVTAGTGTTTAGSDLGVIGRTETFTLSVAITDADDADVYKVVPAMTGSHAGSSVTDANWIKAANLVPTLNSDDDFVVTNPGDATDGNIIATYTVDDPVVDDGTITVGYAFTPDAVGTYILTFTTSQTTGDGATITNAAVTYTLTVVAAAGAISIANTTTDDGTALASSKYTSNPVRDALQISAFSVVAGSAVILHLTAVGGGVDSYSRTRVSMRTATSSYGTIIASHANANTTAGAEDPLTSFDAPTVPGTYLLDVTVANNGTGTTASTYAAATDLTTSVTMTVTAPTGFSPTLSTAHIIAGGATGAEGLAGDADTDAVTASGSGTAAALNRAAITVTFKNTSAEAMATGNTLTAQITSGPGYLIVNTDDAIDGDECSATPTYGAATGRAISAFAVDAVSTVYVCADGTAGVATIVLSVTNNLVTTTWATKSVTFFGAVRTLSVATTNFTIGAAGGDTTGAADASRDATGEVTKAGALTADTSTPAFIIAAKDSAGQLATAAAAPTVITSDPTVVSSGTCVLDDGATVYSSGEGFGLYNCSFTTAATAVSGQSATLTFRIADPLGTAGIDFLTTTATVTVGGARFTETLSLDKSSYVAGEAMVVTRTAKDSAGNPVADGSSAPVVVFNKAIGGTAPGAGFYKNGTLVTSTTRPAVFAPTASGVFEARMDGRNGSTATVAITTTATVGESSTEAAANAASDAASEAIDAANAATDAANLAAEAADAATVAAEEARDAADAATAAVEALATEVATLMAALKAQITTLANVVAKIAKRTKS